MTEEKKKRGFAVMDPALAKAIASKGGKAAHALGRAHRYTSEEAKVNGAKGGRAMQAKRRAAAEGGGQ